MKKFNIGIDLGSRMAKIVLLENGNLIYSQVTDTGVFPQNTATKLLEDTLKTNNLQKENVNKIYSTGYGRNIVPFSSKRISEISCHAKGVSYFFPQAKTVIDIGGQDSKIILLGAKGKVLDFVMNDKCAAGTGRFLEVAANILEISVQEMGPTALKSKEIIDINSTCVVFAESEIIGLIAAGIDPADIVNSVHRSIAKRIKNLMAQLAWQKPVVFTGGVAQNSGMRKSISDTLDMQVESPNNSLITGALGAALYAFDEND